MEEVTGLHAFDHLDPVSALNVLPDEATPEPAPPVVARARAPREPVPASRGRSLPPPPPPRGGPAGMSVPPPPAVRRTAPPPPPASLRPSAIPPTGLAQSKAPTLPVQINYAQTHSAPPLRASHAGRAPVASPSSPSWARARASAQEATGRPLRGPIADDDLTQRVEVHQQWDDTTRVNSDSDDVEPTSIINMNHDGQTTVEPLRGMNPDGSSPQGLMDLSATSVATSIDMEWDEDDEPQTNMRDELPSGIPPRSSSMDFDPVVHVPAMAPASFSPPAAAATRPSLVPPPRPSAPPTSGEPSPFVLASRAPVASSWEDDAQTNYLPPPVGGFGVPEAPSYVRTRTATDDIDFSEPSRLRGSMPWLALAAVLAVGLAFGVRAMMAPPALATVTLVTEPADAEVSVDGRPLVGQASPFTIQGLSPQTEHLLVVRSDGFAEASSSFKVDAGETKALPNVELKPVNVDTGFVLTSQPEGAAVFVDGEPRDLQTPVRISDLAPGLHTVRLEQGNGGQAWETQVAIAAGQMIELPIAQLAAAPKASAKSGDSEPEVAIAKSDTKRASSSKSSPSVSRGERKVSRAEQARLDRKARRAERRAEREAAKSASASTRRAPVAAKAAPAAVARPMPAAAGGGTLRVNTRPWSQVFVDGRLVGNTPQLAIPLSAGSHKLKLVSPDLGMTKQMSIKIGKGQTITKVINLVE